MLPEAFINIINKVRLQALKNREAPGMENDNIATEKTFSINLSHDMKTSRQYYNEVWNKLISYPVRIRSLIVLSKAIITILECSRCSSVEPSSEKYKNEGEIAAHFKNSKLLTETEQKRITGLSFIKYKEAEFDAFSKNSKCCHLLYYWICKH